MLFKDDLRRMLSSPKIYVSYVVALAILLRPLFNTLKYGRNLSFIYLQSLPFGLSDYSPFAAIFCVFPFADSFCEDYNSGYSNAIALRIGTKKYAWQRAISTAFSGGFCTGFTVFTVLVVCYISATVPDDADSIMYMHYTIWDKMDLLLRYNGIFFAVGRVLAAFLFGSLWALVGLCVSTVVTNKYVTLIAPFVLYQILWLLLKGAFNPVQVLTGDSAPSIAFLVGYPLTQIAMCCVFSALGIQKKVRL